MVSVGGHLGTRVSGTPGGGIAESDLVVTLCVVGSTAAWGSAAPYHSQRVSFLYGGRLLLLFARFSFFFASFSPYRHQATTSSSFTNHRTKIILQRGPRGVADLRFRSRIGSVTGAPSGSRDRTGTSTRHHTFSFAPACRDKGRIPMATVLPPIQY